MFASKKEKQCKKPPKRRFLGVPEKIRTPDLLIRSQALYPAELPVHEQKRKMEATTGFEPVVKVLQTFALPLGYVAKHLLGKNGAEDEIRTRDPRLGKAMLYL